MDKKSWNDTWGQIDWGFDCKTKVKKKINELYNAGVSLDMLDYKGERAPIHYIAELYPSDVLALLMRCGALTALRAKDGLTAMHYAVKGNKPENIEILLKHGVTDIEVLKDKWDRTALDFAAHAGKTEIVKALCDHNPNLINVQNRSGWTALHYAAFYGFDEMAAYLLEHGADVNMKTKEGKFALNLSQRKYDAPNNNVKRMLIEKGANVEGQSDALNWAAIIGDKDMVEKLLERGAIVDDNTLINAVASQEIPLIEMFLDNYPNMINLKDGSPVHYTPLHTAIHVKDPKLVKLLIERGADVNIPDANGHTVLQKEMASFYKKPEIIELLQKADKIRARYLKKQAQPKTIAKHNSSKSDNSREHE
ncbi:MAG: ankyrin repeat domain-containing protein [Alphaproteobacteria bacterium]|nr:ankyrin repeat domain-containing protein [Alphaproteobacteria bacterium]